MVEEKEPQDENELVPGEAEKSSFVDIDKLLDERAKIDDLLYKKFFKQITVMFTDLKGSTELADVHGDMAVRLLIKRHNDILFSIISRNHGKVVKTMGDGTMSYFKTAEEGVQAAVEIQRDIEKHNKTQPPIQQIKIRIGLNTGKGIVEKNDIFGDVVNVASRVESAADPGGIIVAEDTYTEVKSIAPEKFTIGFNSWAKFKGKAQPAKIYKVYWSDKDIEQVKKNGLPQETPMPAFQSQTPPPDTATPAILDFENEAKKTVPLTPLTIDVTTTDSEKKQELSTDKIKSLAAETPTLLDGVTPQIPAPKIVILKGAKLIGELPLGAEPVTIGRSQQCQYQLPEVYISRQHIKISPEGGGYRVENLSTHMGLTSHGRKIEKQKLHDGDIFETGDYHFVFREKDSAEHAASGMVTSGVTQVVESKVPGKLFVFHGSGFLREFIINKGVKDIFIGRAPDRDIVLDDKAVSRLHARIYFADDEFHVEDLKSNNGTLLNGMRVASASIRLDDEIGIADYVIYVGSAGADADDFKDRAASRGI